MSDYLIAGQYEYAKKTGNWESGKVLTHGQALNDNQKIVFDYLKSNVEQGGKSIMYSIFLLGEWNSRNRTTRNVDIAYCGLNGKQEAEVLAAFAQWGLEQEEAE
ncbi:hypothetical protein OK7_05625 [Enterococcus faecium EnGen0024]|uniref:Uncharacterized protein n=1 Tax=Enterococcus faecium 10/96A TaxID=1391465 RepID=A0AAV3KXD0_ENTFC|nr:hypothetical protein [Enterococcus faecium]ELB34952.1 hypothetical protein OK7_05625 [Enterococcus faecium EnGen0024]ERT44394.1 hypothetical protein O991_03430 [Enterococcus faecium 10/96A]HAZ4689483.1 hypothetical protein [Enterococcus faecium]